VFLETDARLEQDNDYLGMIGYLHDKMPINTVCMVGDKDFEDYLTYKRICIELSDIQKKDDLHDPRVKVYCQPVFNIEKQTYDTAEALMRLELDGLGMIYPDVFIPIAEKNHYIETLTRIILSKTCERISLMNQGGYNVRRISVNFTMCDVRQETFCTMVQKIVQDNGIDFEQIAIELTESQNEQDFELIKSRINELKGTGIKFYLDDFGTGYSNFERIMELPFDIIKFDRSMVTASGSDEKFRNMVAHMAGMFVDVDYDVLYEGVENEADEALCMGMNAAYLQGYKYSRPIPIERLTEYFEKVG
jgi:EAL domain-containing protein (putative c-di-GMP-specific phosphodiesterase class I)